jgi:opacity protein-like surface antigen
MDLKPYLGPAIAALIFCAASSVLAQTAPAATQGNIPLSVGAGLSAINPDFDHGHLFGATLWIDYTLPHMPHILHGIGLEAEARDLNYGRTGTIPPGLREDIASGGVIYSWPHFRNFRPYAKVMVGYGNADEENTNVTPVAHWHDSRTFTSGGGGWDYRVHRSVWVRVDYEYESWPNINMHQGSTKPSGRFNPQGFTVGAMYHFSHRH